MNSKRGVTANAMWLIIVTGIIIAILLFFVFGANFIKELDDVRGEVSVMNESVVGIGDMYFYMDEYKKLVEIRIKSLEAGNEG